MRSCFNLEWRLYKMAAGYCLEISFLPCSLQSLVKCLPRFPFSFSVTPLFLQEFYLPQVFQESKYRKCIFKKFFCIWKTGFFFMFYVFFCYHKRKWSHCDSFIHISFCVVLILSFAPPISLPSPCWSSS